MTMTISPIYIWVGVLTFCLVAEACTVQLITIWFAVGSVGAMAEIGRASCRERV